MTLQTTNPLHDCWTLVERGIMAGWLDDDSLRELVQALDAGTDLGIQELAFEHLGDTLRVSFLDEQAGCSPAELRAAVAALIAGRLSLDADLLITWCQTLCRTASSGASEIAAALGLLGSVMPHGAHADLMSLPVGIRKLLLVGGEADGGTLDITPTVSNHITRASLERRFGAGEDLPRIGPTHAHQVGYHVVVPGSPFTCTLLAHFREAPRSDAIATTIVLRRERAPRC